MRAETRTFDTPDGVKLVGDLMGPADGRPVLLLHGGGQTRASWRDTLPAIAELGFRVCAVDARGHGESDYSASGDYTARAFCSDLDAVIDAMGPSPILIGASLGGIVALLIAGEEGPERVGGLVLVDVAASTNPYGVKRIQGFMRANPEGFASLEEAADAVARFATDRPRPRNPGGLARNLRLRDGRYYWHWDPEVFFQMSGAPTQIEKSLAALRQAAKTLTVPTLYVRGGKSNVVTEEGARAFLELVPHAQYANIAGAHHMVAGDANDAFNDAVSDFIGGLS